MNKEIVEFDVSDINKITVISDEEIKSLSEICRDLEIKGIEDKDGFKRIYQQR